MSAKSDPRGPSRRGSTGFGADIGYDAANDAPAPARTYHPPATIQQINAAIRMAQTTGRCTVCGSAVISGAGATCKMPACVSKWVLGR